MMNGADLLKSIREKESKVRELLQSDPRSNEREVLDLLNRLRKAYRALIVQHVDGLYEVTGSVLDNLTPLKDSRDIAGHAWRSCFYKQISEFRGALKRHTANMVAISAAAGVPDPGAVHREQVHVARLTQGLLGFLSDSISYFQRIVHELEERTRNATGQGADWLRRCCVTTVYRCLLYLGDLSRYREMYSERTQKDFSEALRYYERAALLEPASGNAQNQLAVLATYCEADCVAAYHHCRSILSVAPFSGGFENLSALLAKNAAAARALAVGAQGGRTAVSAKRTAPAQLPAFLTRFLQVHGVLFGYSTRMHRAYAQMRSSQQSQPSGHTPAPASSGSLRQQHWAPTLGPAVVSALGITGGGGDAASGPPSASSGELEERFAAMLQLVLEEFDEQLSAGSIPDLLLVRLLAICVFSVHYATGGEANLLGWQDSVCTSEGLAAYTRAQGDHPRSTAEALALTALFGLVNRTATRLAAAINSSDRGARSLYNRSLPMLAVFATWAASHPAYLDPRQTPCSSRADGDGKLARSKPSAEAGCPATDESVAPPAMFADNSQTSSRAAEPGPLCSQRWEETYLASAAADRTEARARSALKAALAELAPRLEAQVERARQKEQAAAAAEAGQKKGRDSSAAGLLREHVELRGFLPVAARIEAAFQGFDPLATAPQLLPDAVAHVQRARAVLEVAATLRAGQQPATREAIAPVPPGDPLMGPSKGQRQRGSGSKASATKAKQRAAPANRSASPDPIRPAPPASVRGPPAVPSGVAVLRDGGPPPSDQALPLSPLDFPALPSRVPAAAGMGTGTGTQHEEEDEENEEEPADRNGAGDDDEGLDDVVVFQSAFVRAHGNSSRDSLGGSGVLSGAASGGPTKQAAASCDGPGWQVPNPDQPPLWGANAASSADLLGSRIASENPQSKGSFFSDLGLAPLDHPLDNPSLLPAPFGSALFAAQQQTIHGAPRGNGAASGLGSMGGTHWVLGDGHGGWDTYLGTADTVQGRPQQFSEPALDISFLLDCDTPLVAPEADRTAPLCTGFGQQSQLPRWLTEGGGPSRWRDPSAAPIGATPAPGASTFAAHPPGLNRAVHDSGLSSSTSSLAALGQDLAASGARSPARPPPASMPPRPPGLG